MTSHLRAVLLRTGVVAVLAAGAMGVVTTPAYAAPEDLTITLSTGSFDLDPGESLPLTVRLTNSKDTEETVTVLVGAPNNLGGDVTIETSVAGCAVFGTTSVRCTGVMVPKKTGTNGTKDLEFTLKAKSSLTSIQPGGSPKTGSGSVSIEFSNNNGQAKSFSVTLRPPAVAAPVKSVSGQVTDSTNGTPVKAATVTLLDGAKHSYQTSTDASGNYEFTSTADKPIAAGQLGLTVTKTPQFDDATAKTFTGESGKDYPNTALKLVPKAATPSAGSTTDAAAPVSTDGGVTTATAATAAGHRTDSTGPGTFSLILVGLGGLLVLLGIGAIVMLVVRRKGDDVDPDDDPADPYGPGSPPDGAGGYQGGPPPGRGRGADPTMIARSGPARSNANDATTMLRPQRSTPGEYNDYSSAGGGYGSNPARGGGYAGGSPAGGGYAGGGQAGGGYDQAGQAGYGSDANRYDDGRSGGSPRRSGPPPGRGERPSVDWLDD